MKTKYIQIESKNALLELIRANRDFSKIFIAQNAYKDLKTKEILEEAKSHQIPVETVSRRVLDRRARNKTCESIIGFMFPQHEVKLKELLEDIYKNNDIPFLIIFDHVKYSLNIGAIMRTAFAGFVNGVITPIKRSSFITDESMRVSMGACERIPIVQMNLFAAVKELKENGIKVVALEVGGENYFDADLTGPIAIVIGAEDTGVSSRMLERVDQTVTLPMREGISFLNVNASTGIIIYEKIRQEAAKYAAEH